MRDEILKHDGADCGDPCTVCTAEKVDTQARIDAEHARAWERANRPDVHVAIDHAEGHDETGRVLRIVNDDGLLMVLDALTRYLASKPLETSRAIAALVKSLPHSAFPSVSLGSQGREGVDLLTSLDARVRTFPGSEGHPLTYALLEIDGVEFTAVYTDRGGT